MESATRIWVVVKVDNCLLLLLLRKKKDEGESSLAG